MGKEKYYAVSDDGVEYPVRLESSDSEQTLWVGIPLEDFKDPPNIKVYKERKSK